MKEKYSVWMRIAFVFIGAIAVWLLNTKIVVAADGDQAVLAQLRNANQDKLASELKFVATTEQAVMYTFVGLENEIVLDDVLQRLAKMQSKGTFFIMERDLRLYPKRVEKIIAQQQEIGIAIRPRPEAEFDEVAEEILRVQKQLHDQYQIETKLVKQPWGTIGDSVKEAVSALGCSLIGQTVNVVQGKHKDMEAAEDIMTQIFGKSVASLGRGQIVHFRLDFYRRNHLIGELMELIKVRKLDNIAYRTWDDNPTENSENDSAYWIKSVGEVLENQAFLYAYPIDRMAVPERLRNTHRSFVINEENFRFESAKRYIGAPTVSTADRMLGFTNQEMRRLDQSGLIRTDDPVVFFTFDDWGHDASVNPLLYVLRKHRIPATFFIITNRVLTNPNLLRSIAREGHDIGSHSDLHKPMVLRDAATGNLLPGQDGEEYFADLSTAYQKLESVVGDVEVNGKYALTRYFRPPTLAISKMGLLTNFAIGNEYVISGSYSTGDYAVESVEAMVRELQKGIYTKRGVQKGAVLVMHMTESAAYTARALDLLLTANALRSDADPFKFKVGRLSDYVTEGYSQADTKVKHNLIEVGRKDAQDKTGN